MAKKAVAAPQVDLDSLSSLAVQTAELESSHRDAGRDLAYLTLVGNTAMDPVKNKGKPEYIEGVQDMDWVIKKHKLNLGSEVLMTVRGIYKVYEDSIPGKPNPAKPKEEPMRVPVGYWMPATAEQIELGKDTPFDRPYVSKDGVQHILRCQHWLLVSLKDHPEIKDAVITLRGKANGICKTLQKDIASSAVVSTELVFKLSSQLLTAERYSREYVYAQFDIVGKNFELIDGKLTLVKGGLKPVEIQELLTMAHAEQEEYVSGKMVPENAAVRQVLLAMGNVTKQIAAPSASYVVEAAEEERPAKF